jgi:geranylgeranyl pyrophosphate synthase
MVNNQLAGVSFLDNIQNEIRLVDERMLDQADGHHPDLGSALKHLLSSGGKRIRPAVALLTGEMLSAQQDKVITLSAAIELLHTATLVHDDLIDGARLRRGIETLNAQWSPAATVLTGDFVFAQAAKLAAQTDSVPVMQLFAETLATIVNGEITQLFTSKGLASLDDYYDRIYAKTASMFELSTAASALLSPADGSIVEEMRSFGYDIGMAFQIVDDILDFTGEQITIGKPVASDLRQGLITLPALYYFQDHPDNAILLAIQKNAGFSEKGLQQLVIDINNSGAIDKSFSVARKYVDSAVATIDKQPMSGEREALKELAQYIIKRHS